MLCKRNCKECLYELCVYKLPLFSSLSRHELEKAAEQLVQCSYKKGERILTEGEPPPGLTIFQRGSAKAFTLTPDGREQILYLFTENDYFGEQFIFQDGQMPFSVEAMADTVTYTLGRERFAELVRSQPSIALQVIASISKRLSRLEASLQSMSSRSADGRIASLLLEYMEDYGSPAEDGILIHLPMSREGIASYLGIARETLSRKMSQLESDRILRAEGNKSIVLLQPDALKSLAFA